MSVTLSDTDQAIHRDRIAAMKWMLGSQGREKVTALTTCEKSNLYLWLVGFNSPLARVDISFIEL